MKLQVVDDSLSLSLSINTPDTTPDTYLQYYLSEVKHCDLHPKICFKIKTYWYDIYCMMCI